MAKISIGSNIIAGGSIVISGGRVIVDGTDVTPDAKVITIVVNGDLQTLDVEACERVEVTGNVGSIRSQAGDVRIGGSVTGDVENHAGDIDIDGTVGGNVSTRAGDIRYRK